MGAWVLDGAGALLALVASLGRGWPRMAARGLELDELEDAEAAVRHVVLALPRPPPHFHTYTLAHANCTLFCAPNAQKKTGSQQGKKTIFLDV